ncbi:hypothetical protein TIFTF001_038762 [Ficus carica]|uniref:Protein PYRICULARIA ORYZAE RESISTANCE 21-like n=1 Tax=Ficus carica TaxID=3494 RepID=A0AA88EJ25_FICCA|nr:hypothetical protein TIFTF001_038762 [Ficus carica]
MVLEVDLQCDRCYRKIKCILCLFDEVKDQVYDDKKNTVTITVISCDPERLKRRLLCKGKGVIKSIIIKLPDKPDKLDKPSSPHNPKSVPSVPVPVPCVPCVPICPIPVPGPCRPPCCCKDRCECHCDGRNECRCGGPCFHRHNIDCGPPPSNPCDGHWRRPVCQSYGSGKFYFSTQGQEYCSDPTCRIM